MSKTKVVKNCTVASTCLSQVSNLKECLMLLLDKLLFRQVCEELQEHVNIPEVVELCYILTRPNMRAVLNIHDQVANQEYEPEIPEFPADTNAGASDEEDANIKVVRLVKSVEPLVRQN